MIYGMKMKKFELVFTTRDETFHPISFDKIEADNLVELLSQFLLVIARASKLLIQAATEKRYIDDDIPF